jgi:N-methylhydantoinase A/oxoprolinase/acetone carboxylase beta subunit
MRHGNLIPFDMGGTSTDISLIVGGEAAITSDRRLAGQKVALQSLDITPIGAGGGSLARVDASGVLHVGPQSAGAVPAPPVMVEAQRSHRRTPIWCLAFDPTTSWEGAKLDGRRPTQPSTDSAARGRAH